MSILVIFLVLFAISAKHVHSQEVIKEVQCNSSTRRTAVCWMNTRLIGDYELDFQTNRDDCLERHVNQHSWSSYLIFSVSGGCQVLIRAIRTPAAGSRPSESLTSWNAWSDWSSCSNDCKQIRTRTCSTDNISGCDGDAEETRDCTGDDCETQEASTDQECGKAAPTQSGFRVVGGNRAGENEFPWMVVVSANPSGISSTVCGGSIIDEKHVLTAAHCVAPRNSNQIYRESQVTVLSGTSDLASRRSKRNRVKRIIAHPRYNANTIVYDIALIELTEPLTFDNRHRPICMLQDNELTALETCRVMGWGKTQNGNNSPVSRKLMWAPQTNTTCQGTFGRIRPRTFCARGVNGDRSGSCNGDSGGPLVCEHQNGRHYQYGIVSAGIPNRCGIRPSLYTDVYQFRDWIKDNMA